MMVTVDDRGRLFVSESTGLNLKKADLEKQTPNRIRLLEDTNNDGIYDKTSIFADKMTFPQGGCWLNGTLYVASPPGIWALTDTDDDGVVDFGFAPVRPPTRLGCPAGPRRQLSARPRRGGRVTRPRVARVQAAPGLRQHEVVIPGNYNANFHQHRRETSVLKKKAAGGGGGPADNAGVPIATDQAALERFKRNDRNR